MDCGTHGSGEDTHEGSAERLEERMRWVGNVARKGVEKNTYREDLWRYV